MWKVLKGVALLIRTAPRDARAFWKYGKYVGYMRVTHFKKKTVPMIFQDVVKQMPSKVMLIQGERSWTYKEAEDFSNQVANHFSEKGLKPGDDVALMMDNRPEMVLIWLGLSKIGVSTALMNTSLRHKSLYHCITTVNTKAVIFGPEVSSSIMDIAEDLYKGNAIQLHCLGPPPDGPVAVEDCRKLSSASREPPKYRGNLMDPLLYVLTSGTTGMPKAALVRHSRFILTSAVPRFLAGVTSNDTQYIHMPLYHSSAGVLGMSQPIIHGVSTVIATKFSASNFWEECTKYHCTVTQYIGEICRYLYAQPEKTSDRQHSVRMMYGNGLRPQLWKDFSTRFGVSDIKELYGSSEGSGNVINMDNYPGAVGCMPTVCRLSPLINRQLFHRFIIKIHPETGVPLRDDKGLCIPVDANEPGEYVADIIDSKPECHFDGYNDSKESSKKIYHNVITKGDRCFATGDILLYNDEGQIFFKDRTGDTFRWKGENVSTAEVEAVVSNYASHADCVVIGVEVPGCEGKAGMAIILDPDTNTDLTLLLENLSRDLPPFAIPLFVRLTNQVDMTGTFKLPKIRFNNEGYDITRTRDPIFFLHPQARKYVSLDNELYKRILSNGASAKFL